MHDTSPPPRPQHVGILALHFHLPCYAVRQEDLERAHGVPAGKYTAGLGQDELGFGPAGAEDACSRALSAADALLTKHNVPARAIARIDVGTETSPDRSKSIASVLCGWLESRARAEAEAEAAAGDNDAKAPPPPPPSSHPSSSFTSPWDLFLSRARNSTAPAVPPFAPVEAVDHTHACYGGCAALFAAAAWVESSAWDGQSLALVVATDGAVYPPDSPARATGGGGAAALLVGPGAPLVLEGWPCGRAAVSAHAFDFYKPIGRGGRTVGQEGGGGGGTKRRRKDGEQQDEKEEEENGPEDATTATANADADDDPSCPRSSSHYPIVDGAATTDWFLAAAEAAARQWLEQQRRAERAERSSAASAAAAALVPPAPPKPLLSAPTAAFVCHAPFARMVRKTLGRLALVDAGARAQWAKTWPAEAAAAALAAGEAGSTSPCPLLLQQATLQGLAPAQRAALAAGVAREAGVGVESAALAPLSEAATAAPDDTNAPGPPSTKALDDALAAALKTSGDLERLAGDGMSAQTRVGNAYTASVFLGLAALLERRGGGGSGGGGGAGGESPAAAPLLPGQRILLFTFGSGVVAALFTLRVRETEVDGGGKQKGGGGAAPPRRRPTSSRASLPASGAALGASQDLERRLSARPLLSAAAFDAAAAADEDAAGSAPYRPPSVRACSVVVGQGGGEGEAADADAAAAASAAAAGGSVADLPSGAWYLSRVDARYRRVYARRGLGPVEEDQVLGGATLRSE
jgi:hydroxymethylglutaryl-CoA synthase